MGSVRLSYRRTQVKRWHTEVELSADAAGQQKLFLQLINDLKDSGIDSPVISHEQFKLPHFTVRVRGRLPLLISGTTWLHCNTLKNDYKHRRH